MSSTEWQDALLYHAAWGHAKEVFSETSIDDFDPGDRQNLFAIMERGYLTGELNPAWVGGEVVKVGKPSQSFTSSVLTNGFTGTVAYYASRLRDETSKRYVTAALTRGLQKLSSNETVTDEVVMEVQTELQSMPKPSTTNDDTWTLEDIMGLSIEETQFTIPGLLKRNERLVLTGSEGGGKSVFIYQMLTGAAFGVDTFSLDRMEPKRVLFMDVENNEMQARSNLDKIVPVLREMVPDAQPEWRSMKRRVVDLMSPKDRTDVIRRVMHYSPDILYMGTAYKLTDVSDDTHRSVRAIQSVVDRIRQEVDCSVIVEHHAGHGTMNDRNNMRPEGSSYWLRWPDFGYGMQPLTTENGRRLMRLGPWRGDRATDRNFPVAVKQSEVLPWSPVYADEWEAMYADKYDK